MANSTRVVQDRLWRTSQAYQFLKWRRRQTRLRRMWKVAKKTGETMFVALVVLVCVGLMLVVLFGLSQPLP